MIVLKDIDDRHIREIAGAFADSFLAEEGVVSWSLDYDDAVQYFYHTLKEFVRCGRLFATSEQEEGFIVWYRKGHGLPWYRELLLTGGVQGDSYSLFKNGTNTGKTATQKNGNIYSFGTVYEPGNYTVYSSLFGMLPGRLSLSYFNLFNPGNDYLEGLRVNGFDIKITGIIINRFNTRKNLNKAVEQSIKNEYGDVVFKTIIRENVSLAEVPLAGGDIQEYAPSYPDGWYCDRTPSSLLGCGARRSSRFLWKPL